MSHDPYSPCMCGSGKKLKFCCQDILADLIRAEKLVETQPQAAEKLLRSLLEKNPDKEVLATQLTGLLIRERRLQDARDLLVSFLQRNPDEPRTLLALAEVCLITDGFWKSRRIVHRAFQLSSRQYPDGVATLAANIASQMAQAGFAMGVREHLALAVRMSRDEQRNSMMMRLANFEAQQQVPFPFRGRFALMPVELEDGLQKSEELRARKVSQIGCWEPAAIIYSRLVQQAPDNAALWYNLGLFRAWDGQLQQAAEALHRAAQLLDDFDAAVEAETLAQLLEQDISDDTYGILQDSLNVTSVSELLTRLDNDPRFARVVNEDNMETDDGRRIAAEFEYLSQPLPDEPLTADNLPDVVGELTVIDAGGGDNALPAAVLLTALDDDLDTLTDAFRSVAGDLVQPDDEAKEKAHLSRLPESCRLFDWKIHQSEKVGNVVYRDIDKARLQDALEKWLETPHPALDGKTPLEAAGDEKYKVRLAAAVLLLEITCNRMGYAPDLSEIRSRLNVPPRTPLQLEESQSVIALPLLQFSRVDVTSLTDEQLVDYANRVTLVRQLQLLEKALDEIVKRPEALKMFSPLRAWVLKATIARDNNQLEQASECFAEARKAAEHEEDAFRTRLELDIRELSTRLDNPQDASLPDLLRSIRDRYFRKIPEIEDVIREELQNSGCQHLLPVLETQPSATSAETGLWTPDAHAAQQDDKPSGLWLPGQN